MIFVTVGTQLPFDRLVRAVDMWAAAHPDIPVRAQTGKIGADGYHPQHMQSDATIPPMDYDRLCSEAQLIVAHAGTGSLIKAQTLGRPILAMPRVAALEEHRNDHQRATATHFSGRGGIFIAHEADEVGPAIDMLLAGNVETVQLNPFAGDELLSSLRSVIYPVTKA